MNVKRKCSIQVSNLAEVYIEVHCTLLVPSNKNHNDYRPP